MCFVCQFIFIVDEIKFDMSFIVNSCILCKNNKLLHTYSNVLLVVLGVQVGQLQNKNVLSKSSHIYEDLGFYEDL